MAKKDFTTAPSFFKDVVTPTAGQDKKINTAAGAAQATAPATPAAPVVDEIKPLTPLERETKSKKVQLMLKPSLHRKGKAAADALGLSFNEYMNQLLEKS